MSRVPSPEESAQRGFPSYPVELYPPDRPDREGRLQRHSAEPGDGEGPARVPHLSRRAGRFLAACAVSVGGRLGHPWVTSQQITTTVAGETLQVLDILFRRSLNAFLIHCPHTHTLQATQPALYTPSLPQAGGGRKKRESLVSAMGAQGAAEKAVAAGGIGVGGSPQPAPLAFDIREIERFRYRVEDTIKKVGRELQWRSILELGRF